MCSENPKSCFFLKMYSYYLSMGRDSIVDIATRYGLDGRVMESR